MSGSRIPRRRPFRRDTRPDTPKALRENAGEAAAADTATAATAITSTPSPDPAPGKAGTR